MKLVFFLCALILNFTIAYSQAGQKWSLSGNNSTAGDFIGATNNRSHIAEPFIKFSQMKHILLIFSSFLSYHHSTIRNH